MLANISAKRLLSTLSFSNNRESHSVMLCEDVSACVADVLRLKAVSAGVVLIQGDVTGRYLAMDQNGHLYGSVRFSFLHF